MADYRDHASEIAALGAGIAGLSVDPPERSAGVRSQLGLPFVLLSDTERRVVEGWGLLNAREKGGIAYPAVYVIDRDRTVLYRSLDRLASRVSADAVVGFLAGREAPPSRAWVWPGWLGFRQAIANGLRFGVRNPRGR